MEKLQALVSHLARLGAQYKEKITPAYWLSFITGGLVLVFFSLSVYIPLSGHYADELGVTSDGQTVTIEETPQEKAPVITKETVRTGQSVYSILQNEGLSPQEIHQITGQLKGSFSIRSFRPGKIYETEKSSDGSLIRFSYFQDRATTITVQRDIEAGPFSVNKEIRDFETRTVALEGTVEHSLARSLQAKGRRGLLPGMQKLLGTRVDFRRDIAPGTHYRALFEEKWLGDDFISTGTILAAEIKLPGRSYRAYRYTDAKGIEGYYDEKGRSVERISRFAKPCNYSRVSSRFGYRTHPIFRTRHFHGGVDLAAPRGTPVKATANGRVIFKGRKGGAGNMITIAHAGGDHSQYLHLSRFALITRYGARVKQGQIIGYVGSTGNSTGPHLDFRIIHRGKHINPLTALGTTSSRTITRKEMVNFLAEVSLMKAKLDDRSTFIAGSDNQNGGAVL
ncbi:M23 family metallopeptidase [Chlorobium phaeovibrioides]|uniref:M23 family metallopeptidase n=1 Tax=Chlorobium phaeovibrioides TaxID=1094 RepID=A0A3S0NAC5_CHLPH|nr:M23 family metallopeptidase [Chlorobium phaeovibrioides]RTY37866.1 M23 family metallopeptidase [Chlorobium phaeovibrioides]